MANQYGEHATWCQKLNEITEVIVVEQDTSWKIWTTVTKDAIEERKDYFKFIIKQHSGPKKCAYFEFNMKCGPNGKPCKFSNFVDAMEYNILPFPIHFNDQFVISVEIELLEPYKSKPVEKWTDKDYIISIGDKMFAVDQSVSEKLKQYARGKNLHEVELNGVDYEDVITMIDNPELIKDDITVERWRKYANIEKKYGIKCHSKEVQRFGEQHFWCNTDKMDSKVVYDKMTPFTTTPDQTISKKVRVLSFPSKICINAFDINLDFYMYIQEYNNISYLSIGVISDKATDNEYCSCVISLNIQLHHPQNPELNRSVDITRDFNNYQRSAGCPTFMLSSELGDYMHQDGSFVVTITLSPTVITNDIQYPGIKDVMICKGNREIMVSRDLILHYCEYFKTLPNTDKLSVDIFPIDSMKMLLDLIYHRSTALNFANIQKLLNISEAIVCPYAYNYCDKLLADQYDKKLLSINRTKEFLDGWDLPQLKEAEKMKDYVEPVEPTPRRSARRLPWRIDMGRGVHFVETCTSTVYTSALPSGARIVEPLTVNRLVDLFLPLEVFKDKSERARLCEQFYAPNGILKLNIYRRALFTLEGVPKQLRMDLRNAYQSALAGYRGSSALSIRLTYFYNLLKDGGFEELKEKAEAEATMVKQATEELKQLLEGNQVETPSIGAILARREEDCRKGRRTAARMFVDRLRMEEGMRKEEVVYDEMRIWVEYFGVSDYKF